MHSGLMRTEQSWICEHGFAAIRYKSFEKEQKENANLWKHLNKTEGICRFNEALQDITHLRGFHKQMDETVIKAYSWEDINPAHDFYEVDYLPENDRIRYTISPDARKEVLKRQLKLNHEIHEQEVKAGLHTKGKSKKETKNRYIKTDEIVLSEPLVLRARKTCLNEQSP